MSKLIACIASDAKPLFFSLDFLRKRCAQHVLVKKILHACLCTDLKKLRRG